MQCAILLFRNNEKESEPIFVGDIPNLSYICWRHIKIATLAISYIRSCDHNNMEFKIYRNHTAFESTPLE